MEHHTSTTSNVSRGTFGKAAQLYIKNEKILNSYLDQLLWWNNRVNLISRNVSRETVQKHLKHSLLLSQFDSFKSAHTIIDAGTGGGLPGIPLAITHPNKDFILNDIVSKKCLAVKQIAQKLGLKNTTTADYSVADIHRDKPFLLISKHAFKINNLYEMVVHLPWTAIALYKGEKFEDELEGIKESLRIHTYDLSNGSEFYKGKALVFIQRS